MKRVNQRVRWCRAPPSVLSKLRELIADEVQTVDQFRRSTDSRSRPGSPVDCSCGTESAITTAQTLRVELTPPRSAPPRRFPWPALLSGAFALAWGLIGITRQGTWWRDEAVTYDMARRSLPDLLDTLQHVDAVHGLYYLLMQGVFAVFGDSVVALRLPSVLATAAAAGGVAAIGHRLAGPRAGAMAGLVFPLLPLVQHYAQEGRSYALVCAAVTWATWLFLQGAERSRGSVWFAYGATALLACLLHEFAILAVLAHGVTLLWSRAPLAVIRAWARVAICVAALLAPLALFSIGQSAQVSWISGPQPVALATCALGALLAHPMLSRTPPGLGVVRVRELGLPLLLVPSVVLLLAMPIKPLYVDRYILYSMTGLALLAGVAIENLLRRERSPRRTALLTLCALAATAAVVPLGSYERTPGSRVDDVQAITDRVASSAAAGDGLLFTPARRRVWADTNLSAFRGLDDLALSEGPRTSHSLYGQELPVGTVRARMLAAHRIVVLSDPPDQPEDMSPREATKRKVLREHFTVCRRSDVHGARITVYARSNSC